MHACHLKGARDAGKTAGSHHGEHHDRRNRNPGVQRGAAGKPGRLELIADGGAAHKEPDHEHEQERDHHAQMDLRPLQQLRQLEVLLHDRGLVDRRQGVLHRDADQIRYKPGGDLIEHDRHHDLEARFQKRHGHGPKHAEHRAGKNDEHNGDDGRRARRQIQRHQRGAERAGKHLPLAADIEHAAAEPTAKPSATSTSGAALESVSPMVYLVPQEPRISAA